MLSSSFLLLHDHWSGQQRWSAMRGEEQCIISSEAWYKLEGKRCTLNERATIRILLGGSNAHWWISFEISKDPLTIKRYLVNQETIKRSINNHKTIKQILENQKIYWQSKDNQKIYWQSKDLLTIKRSIDIYKISCGGIIGSWILILEGEQSA